MLPREVGVGVGMNRSASVKRFERANGIDTALYEKIPLLFYINIFVL